MTELLLLALLAQNVEQRGFIENRALLYPQDTANDSAQAVNQSLFRWEGSYKPSPWLKLNGSFDARLDTHRQVDRELRLNLDDRTTQRPALSLRQLSATIHKDKVTAELWDPLESTCRHASLSIL